MPFRHRKTQKSVQSINNWTKVRQGKGSTILWFMEESVNAPPLSEPLYNSAQKLTKPTTVATHYTVHDAQRQRNDDKNTHTHT